MLKTPRGKDLREGLELAKEVDADIVLATDPDADRLGVYAKDTKTGEYMSFTGNMSGMLILEYILSQRKALGTLPENGAVVTTIVSGKMSKEIAKDYGMTLIETLTGFKYIGEQIKFFEQNGSHEYVFGYEESYGCLVGTHARDKDAVVAVMALCEVAAYCRHQGITLCDQMETLFKKYGYYKEGLCTVTLKGQEGAKKIQSMMEQIRTNVPETVGGLKVLKFRDYREDVAKDCVTGGKTATGLPKSNVLYFELEDDAWCCIRPSGRKFIIYREICKWDFLRILYGALPPAPIRSRAGSTAREKECTSGMCTRKSRGKCTAGIQEILPATIITVSARMYRS